MNNAIHLRSFLYYVLSFPSRVPVCSFYFLHLWWNLNEWWRRLQHQSVRRVTWLLVTFVALLPFPIVMKKVQRTRKTFHLAPMCEIQPTLKCDHEKTWASQLKILLLYIVCGLYAVMHGWWQLLWEISFLDTCVWSCCTFRLVCAPISFPYCLCGFGMSIFPLVMVAMMFMLIFRIFFARVKQLKDLES